MHITMLDRTGGDPANRVTTIGGVFLKSSNPKARAAWFKAHLGLDIEEWCGVVRRWKTEDNRDGVGTTTWSLSAAATTCCAPGAARFVINYRVEDIHALIAALRSEDVKVVGELEESEFGEFAWVLDPEGTKLESWELPAGTYLRRSLRKTTRGPGRAYRPSGGTATTLLALAFEATSSPSREHRGGRTIRDTHFQRMHRLDTISPIRVSAVVLVAVFTVELTIMLLVDRGDSARTSRLVVALIDALVLVAVLWPVLWLLVVRPLRASISERGLMLTRTLRAQEDERARLARDLHDELGQVQSAVLLGARSIVNTATLTEAHARASEVARLATQLIESSRRIARGLAPSVLIDLGLAVAAERLCEDVAAASGLHVDHAITLPAERFGREIEFAAYRVLQEALTNCVKHAGASHVWVTLEQRGESLRLVVADDGAGIGRGPPPDREGGFGLRSMRERVLLQNGTFAINSTPGQGTTVTAALPIVRDPCPS